MNIDLIRIAFFWGLISAVSLPVGALLGLLTRPSRKATSALMAFGAGALLFALTIGLFSEALHHAAEYGSKIIYITIAVLSKNETFGEMALLGNNPRNATAKVKSKTQVLEVLHSDFETALSQSDELRESALVLFHQRAENLSLKSDDYRAEEWESRCLKHLRRLSMPVTEQEINEEAQKAVVGKGAAMAIRLGILLDGIPESLIIGILSASVTGISRAFIAGVFLANLPEAMSSAVGMRKSGMSFGKILLMWGSLCLITGIGAGVGGLLFSPHGGASSYILLGAIEGLAAGAMLTMIAETMLPEAFEQGGAIVGFSTLLGFLTALIIKVL